MRVTKRAVDPSGEESHTLYMHDRVDMLKAPPSSRKNAAGFPRNGPWFWRQLRKKNPAHFSEANNVRISMSTITAHRRDVDKISPVALVSFGGTPRRSSCC